MVYMSGYKITAKRPKKIILVFSNSRICVLVRNTSTLVLETPSRGETGVCTCGRGELRECGGVGGGVRPKLLPQKSVHLQR